MLLLNGLYEEGFFSDQRLQSEVADELGKRGHKVKSSSLASALTSMVQSEKPFTRNKKQGKWQYLQPEPSASRGAPTRTRLFERYSLHPRIKEVSFDRFEDGYFKEAIQNALVEVIDQVKLKASNPKDASGRDLDGDDLMNKVFGCDNRVPLIKFNKLLTGLDKAEQRGIMYLFKGVVGIRDKKAHLNFIQNDPLKTMEYLSLASLLMRLLDEA